jgi:hypothetical protein
MRVHTSEKTGEDISVANIEEVLGVICLERGVRTFDLNNLLPKV